MPKRTRVKGKGAAIFLGNNNAASQQTTETVRRCTAKQANTNKATFYSPVELIDELEDTWLSLRAKYKNRKVTKSEIAQIALEEIVQEWEKKRDDGTVAKRLAGK